MDGSISKPYFCASSVMRSDTAAMSSFVGPDSPSTMFSAAVSTSTSLKCWWIMPMPSGKASFGLRMVTSSPWTKICPSSG